MEWERRRMVMCLLGAGLMSVLDGCAAAAAGSNAKVRHKLEIEVDKSVGRAINIRYTYGDELVDQTRPMAIAIGAFTSYIAAMHIPEEFAISWETVEGKKHGVKVPVRSRLPGSVENKSVIFVIMQDHVECYVGLDTPYGQKRDRFY
jgi:hypothetical protein